MYEAMYKISNKCIFPTKKIFNRLKIGGGQLPMLWRYCLLEICWHLINGLLDKSVTDHDLSWVWPVQLHHVSLSIMYRVGQKVSLG